jgi:hypothetical protein
LDRIQILAREAGTTVALDPPLAVCPTLGPGELCELEIDRPVTVTSEHPILVAHYIQSYGINSAGIAGTADPSMSLVTPAEQYRNDYLFLVPERFLANYVGLVSRTGALATLDGMDVTPALASIGAGTFSVGIVQVSPGAHRLRCSAGCGIEIYGWDDWVSYMTAGGLGLERVE